jgi:uncharacterized membrane protein YczE
MQQPNADARPDADALRRPTARPPRRGRLRAAAGRATRTLILPIPADRRPRRFGQLFIGLLLYGFSMAVMVRAGMGLDPWDVLHQGLADRLPFSFGITIVLVSLVVLLLWIPLRQRPGFGTLANAVVIGLATDASLAVLPAAPNVTVGIIAMLASVPLNALAGALYIGAGLGPGPRDGLMTGLVARGVGRVMVVRTGLEGSVLLGGWLLGGPVGIGTVVYALGIGPLLQPLMPRFAVDKPRPAAVPQGLTSPA